MIIKKISQLLKVFCLVWFSFVCLPADAADRCYSKMSEVLGCFLHYDDGVYKYEFVEENNSNPEVKIRTYFLYSQKWPVDSYEDIPSTIWKHKLVFYIPKTISYTKALLYVNGGRNRNIDGGEEFLSSKENIEYGHIALNNKALVVELQDTLNQYLFFNGQPFKEDRIIAYTYKRFMDDPHKNAYLAGHLPMTKAVLKAMDAVQQVMKVEHGVTIDGFVLAGASKRGWAVWLAALSDHRVEAMIPVVIDVLNTQKSLSYICQSYGGVCPQALRDYEEYNITKSLNTSAYSDLMTVEDPYSYLMDDKYKERFAIPKYIINASGDDFFVPDSSKWYFKDLPGYNTNRSHIRYLPNSMHYLGGNPISDSTNSMQAVNEALNSYFYFVLNKITLPTVNWKLGSDKIQLYSSIKPFLAKLWVANNGSTRDFRFITSYGEYRLLFKKLLNYFFISMGDNCYKEKDISFDCKDGGACHAEITSLSPAKGWQASFAELHYKLGRETFIVTTEVNIAPDVLPKQISNQGEHQDL